MLRVEIHRIREQFEPQVEGRFTGDDAENTHTLLTHAATQ